MIFIRRSKRDYKYLFAVFVILAGIVFVSPVQAATVSLRASAGSVNVGSIFTLRALVNTQGKNINNVESVINFPNDLVEVTSVSSKNSIFSLWVEQPTFSNSSGQVSFNGGIPNPGYNGGGGEIVSVTFKAKSPGVANFYFSGAAVRENDGLGTDILTGQGGASVTINGEKPPEVKPPAQPVVPKLSNPTIYSSTYPDQNAWYSTKNGVVGFRFATGASTIQTLLGNSPYSTPNVSYTPPISSKEIKNLTDGVWYFHLRYQLKGEWSNVAHYRIQIDTIAPKNLTAEVVSTAGLALKLKAEDINLNHYGVSVDGGTELIVSTQEAIQLVPLVGLAVGTHQIKVVAYDKAGNKAEIFKEIKAETLSAPIINSFSENINVGDKFSIAGSSTPKSFIKIALKLENDNEITYETQTDAKGNFFFLSDPINTSGSHRVKAYAFNQDGLVSPESRTLNLFVKTIPISAGISWPVINISWEVVLSVLGWLILIFFLLYGWYKFLVTRRKLLLAKRREQKAYMMLLDRADKEIEVLNKSSQKRKLGKTEEVALSDLREIIKRVRDMRQNED